MKEVLAGSILQLACYGRSVVTKIYMHHDTREMCCDVKSEKGDTLHLSLAYCRTRMA